MLLNRPKTFRAFRNFLFIAFLIILVAIPTLGKAEIVTLRPNDYEYGPEGFTVDPLNPPEHAYDPHYNTFAKVQAVPNAYPFVTYFWGDVPPSNYDSLVLFVYVYSKNFVNDKWGIEYTVDGGTTWNVLKEMSSENSPSSVEIKENISAWNSDELQIRINTDSKGKVDGGNIFIYDIFVEAQTSDPVDTRLEQSSFRFFESIGPGDFYAVNSGVPGVDEAKAIGIHGDFMYVAGFEPGGWRIEKRDLNSGELVNFPITNYCAGEPYSVVVSDESGGPFIYIVGNDYSEGNYQWRIEKRDLDLSPDETFGDKGVVLSNPSENNDTAYAAVVVSDPIYGDHIYIAGSDRSNGVDDAQWRIEARSLVDGSFKDGSDAVTLSNPSNDDDIPYAIDYAIIADIIADKYYLYVAGYDRTQSVSTKTRGKKKSTSNAQWRLEKRPLSDLAQVHEVGFNPKDNFDAITAIAIDSSQNSVYVAGFQEEGFFDTAWRIEKRKLTDLTLDITGAFGDYDGVDDGAVIVDPGYDDKPKSIIVDGQYIYIAGFSADALSGGDTAWHIEKRDKDTGMDEYVIINDIDSENNDRAYDIAIDSGFMYIVGYEQNGLADWRIEKRDLGEGYLIRPLPEQNTQAVLSMCEGIGEGFRLRMLIHVSNNDLIENGEIFKLQVASDVAGAEWHNVSATGDIAFNDILYPEGTALLRTELDPFHDTHLIRYQSYVDNYPFTNNVKIFAGEDGLWEFSLKATVEGTYRFRIVKGELGTELDEYLSDPVVKVVEVACPEDGSP